MKLFKKLNTKGFGHLEILILIVVVVVIAAAGTFVYEHHHNKAHAGGWTLVADYANADLTYACETPISGGHTVTAEFIKPAGWVVTNYSINDHPIISSQEKAGTAFWDNVVAEETLFAPNGYTIVTDMNGLYGTYAASSYVNPSSLASC